MHRKLIPMILLAMVALLAPQQEAFSQIFPISDADTFKVVNAFGQPGEVVPIKLFVVNPDTTLLALTAFFDIDTSFITYEGVLDQGTFFVDTEAIERSKLPYPGQDSIVFDFQPLVMITPDMHRSNLIGAGNGDVSGVPSAEPWIKPGRGHVLQFFVRIKEGVAQGTQTVIRIFQPFQEFGSDDLRACSYSDHLGIRTVYPRIVSGTLTIGEDPGGGDGNSPPSITPLAQTNFAVDPGTNINFLVSASDPDSPQQITLGTTGLPSGAQFGTGGQVTGAGFASGTFSWTPNASHVGNYTVTFTCSDDSLATAVPRSVFITVNAPDIEEGDQLFTTSQPSLGPVRGGTPGLTGLSIPVNLAATQSIYGIQFDFVYNPDILFIDSLVPTERLEDFTIYNDIGDTPGRVRVISFGLNNEQVQSGATSAILNFWVTVRSTASVGKYPIRFGNAYEAISPDPFIPSVALAADTSGIFVVDAAGDVNGDGRIDIADIVAIVGYIIGEVELNARQFSAADMDDNSFVDVIDLQAIINLVFGDFPPSFVSYGGEDAILELQRPSEGGTAGRAELYAELPTEVAGVQVEISYNPDKVRLNEPLKTGMSDRLSLRFSDNGNGKMVVLLYPGEGRDRYMSAGAGSLLEVLIEHDGAGELLDDDLKIEYAVMVDPEALEIPVKNLARNAVLPQSFALSQNYPNPFNPETTIDFVITANSAQSASLSIYNLLGQHVHTLVDDVLPPGSYSYTWYGRTGNGKPAASGVYFYRLRVGDLIETKKMVLLK